ncbi:hypothetical protein AHF37_11411 [Paragonimus kellicotti]|nr:hypothetical protein AHF37_11411 [Paragonimus kellicotti]
MCIFKLSTLVCLLCIPQRGLTVRPNDDGPRQVVYKVPDERVFIVLELEESGAHEDLAANSVEDDGPSEVAVSSQRKENQQHDESQMEETSLMTGLEDWEHNIYLNEPLGHKDVMPWEVDYSSDGNASSWFQLEIVFAQIREHLDEVYLQVFKLREQAERSQSEVRVRIQKANMLYSYAERIRQLIGLSDSLDEIISDDHEDTEDLERESNYNM